MEGRWDTMVSDQQLLRCLALLMLLVEIGAQEGTAAKPEHQAAPLALQGNSWCAITPYPQQNEAAEFIASPPRQVELEEPATSQQGKAGWWIGSTSGIIWGRAREIVFDNSGVQNQNDYLSELLWDLKHTPLFGIKSDWRGNRANHLRMELSFAIPNMPVGKMEDYDWFYTDRDWSHWSLSRVRLRWGFILDVSYEEVLASSGFFKLKLGLGYHMDWWGWKDKIEDSLYSSFVRRINRKIPDKFSSVLKDGFRDRADVLSRGINGINYFAMYHAPLLTVRGSFEWDVIALSVLGRVGPVLGIGKDHHLLRTEFGPDGVFFYDIVFGGPWVDTSLEIEFKITHRFLLSFRGEYAWLNETRGFSIMVPTNEKPASAGRKKGGLAFRRVGVNVFALWKLGQ